MARGPIGWACYGVFWPRPVIPPGPASAVAGVPGINNLRLIVLRICGLWLPLRLHLPHLGAMFLSRHAVSGHAVGSFPHVLQALPLLLRAELRLLCIDDHSFNRCFPVGGRI